MKTIKTELTAKQINKAISKIQNDRFSTDCLKVNFLGFSEEIVSKDFDEKIQNDEKDLINSIILKNDKNKLKEKLVELNVISGIHTILANLENKKNELQVYETIKNNLKAQKRMGRIYDKSTKDVFISEVNAIRNNATPEKIPSAANYQVSFISEKEVEEKLKNLRKEVSKIQDELDFKNNKKTIEVELSEITAELVGLEQ